VDKLDINTNADDEARALFMGTTPERPDDVSQILDNVQFERAHDRPALHLEANAFFDKGLVVFTDRTMQQIWLIAYLSWKTLHEQSSFVIVSQAGNEPYDVSLNDKHDKYVSQVDRLGQALSNLREAEPGQTPWPPDVPRLDPDLSELRDEEDHAAYDLGCFAVSFALLHEVRHAQKRLENKPYDIDEEMECDRFATNFLLDQCEQYASKNNHDTIQVYRKRSMGVFLGLAVMFESTEIGLWLPSESHPSMFERIDQFREIVEPNVPDKNDDLWLLMSCVLLSKARRDNHLPETIYFENFYDLSCKVLKLMRHG